MNARNDKDTVVFVGNGCTEAINKFVRILMKSVILFAFPSSHLLSLNFYLIPLDPSRIHPKPSFFTAHRSIIAMFYLGLRFPFSSVSWFLVSSFTYLFSSSLQAGFKVQQIKENSHGFLDLVDLEVCYPSLSRRHSSSSLQNQLKKVEAQGFERRIGSFSAASNVTGLLIDVRAVTALLHKYNALSCWDYACAGNSHVALPSLRLGPSVKIDMNPLVPDSPPDLYAIDALFISVHKFLGGPGAPGVLVCKKELIDMKKPPTSPGGGTVSFV